MEGLFQPLLVAKTLAGLFFAAVFIQSGLDKLFNRKDNLEWLVSHFSKSFLAPIVPFMLATISLLETAAGFLCLIGVICLYCCDSDSLVFYGISLSSLNLVMLIFGQRIAKDYDGARTIAIYFAVALLGLSLFL